MTVTQLPQTYSKADDRNLSGRLAVQDMLKRVMNVAQLLHSHEQTLLSHGADVENTAEKSQNVDAVVS